MSRHTYTWSPSLFGQTLFDIDVELDVFFDPDGDCISVEGVFIDGIELTALPADAEARTALSAMGEQIARTAEMDREFAESVALAEGYTYSTRGGTDPDAGWRKGAAA